MANPRTHTTDDRRLIKSCIDELMPAVRAMLDLVIRLTQSSGEVSRSQLAGDLGRERLAPYALRKLEILAGLHLVEVHRRGLAQRTQTYGNGLVLRFGAGFEYRYSVPGRVREVVEAMRLAEVERLHAAQQRLAQPKAIQPVAAPVRAPAPQQPVKQAGGSSLDRLDQRLRDIREGRA